MNRRDKVQARWAGAYAKLAEYGPHNRVSKEIARMGRQADKDIRILDIGSGGALYWHEILRESSRPIKLELLDPLKPRILDSLTSGTNSSAKHIEGFAPMSLKTLESDSYDICVAFDLIEHLEKKDGYLLLYEIDRITKGTSIIFTPNGFTWQPPSINNQFNAHISGWQPSEFRALGWSKIEGHTGLKWLIGPYGRSKIKGRIGNLVHLTSILVRKMPKLAFAFSSTKRHGEWAPDRHEGV
jgi:hypothetical protein